jgi:hypothetical protein
MKFLSLTSLVLLLVAATANAAETQKLYRWVDKEGVVHFGDSIPAEYAEIEKYVVNEHGITVDVMRGKRTEEEIAEERRQDNLRVQRELQRRADMALLATYLSIEEIAMHRDRRIELFQAQARVTELYLRNQQIRLEKLQNQALKFQPYSDDPDAPMISTQLANDLAETKSTIDRHEDNLTKFHSDEENIVARFDGDMERFRSLKGLN